MTWQEKIAWILCFIMWVVLIAVGVFMYNYVVDNPIHDSYEKAMRLR